MSPFTDAAAERANGVPYGARPSTGDSPESSEEASAAAPVDPLAPILILLGQLGDQFRRYLETWVDQTRLTIQVSLVRGVFLFVGLSVAVSALIVATGLLMIGISSGLGILLGHNLWAGQMLLGGGVLSLTFIGLWLWRSSQKTAHWNQLTRKYEHVDPLQPADSFPPPDGQ